MPNRKSMREVFGVRVIKVEEIEFKPTPARIFVGKENGTDVFLNVVALVRVEDLMEGSKHVDPIIGEA